VSRSLLSALNVRAVGATQSKWSRRAAWHVRASTRYMYLMRALLGRSN